jgi:hypothetical protein
VDAAHVASFGEPANTQVSAAMANGLSRMTHASAQKEINEPAGAFLSGAADPRELAAQLGRHDQILAALSRRSVMLVRAGDGGCAGPILASSLSPRDRSH